MHKLFDTVCGRAVEVGGVSLVAWPSLLCARATFACGLVQPAAHHPPKHVMQPCGVLGASALPANGDEVALLLRDEPSHVAPDAVRGPAPDGIGRNQLKHGSWVCNSSPRRTLPPRHGLPHSGHTSRREFLNATSLARRALSRWSRKEKPGAQRPSSLRTTLTGADEP